MVTKVEGWRDVKEAPTDRLIFAHAEGLDLIGKIGDLGDGDFIFNGLMLKDGRSYITMREDLDGWNPVPEPWKHPEKSADEMFREIGYAPSKLILARSGCALALYEKDTGDHFYEIEVVGGAPGGDIAFDPRVDGCESCLLGTEVLACAQLIKEMEADNERS